MYDENNDPVHELVHLHVDGAFNRRELVSRVTKLLGSTAAALTALSSFQEELRAQPPQACPAGVQVPLNAPDVVAQDVEFAGEGSKIFAHFAYPRQMNGPQPGLIIVHENRGLTDHIKDVCRRAARAGFVAVAPDLLSYFRQLKPDPCLQKPASDGNYWRCRSPPPVVPLTQRVNPKPPSSLLPKTPSWTPSAAGSMSFGTLKPRSPLSDRSSISSIS